MGLLFTVKMCGWYELFTKYHTNLLDEHRPDRQIEAATPQRVQHDNEHIQGNQPVKID
jgi:hypothetical protein